MAVSSLQSTWHAIRQVMGCSCHLSALMLAHAVELLCYMSDWATAISFPVNELMTEDKSRRHVCSGRPQPYSCSSDCRGMMQPASLPERDKAEVDDSHQ